MRATLTICRVLLEVRAGVHIGELWLHPSSFAGRGEQEGEKVWVGDLLLRAEFEAGLTGGGGRAGVESDLVLLRSVRGALGSSRPVGKYIKHHELHHCYDLIKR